MSGDCDSVVLSDCSAEGPTSAQRSSITGGVWVDGIHVCLMPCMGSFVLPKQNAYSGTPL